MEVDYAEIGTFDAEKAAKGLIDLYNSTNKRKPQNNKNDINKEKKSK